MATKNLIAGSKPTPDESLLMYRVATRHFVEKESNIVIAESLGISRFRVARLIDSARASGIVRTQIDFPVELDSHLAEELVSKYKLQSARTVKGGAGRAWVENSLSSVAIHLVGEILTDGQSLGIAWGRTLDSVAKTAACLTYSLPKIDVVQLVGGVPTSSGSLEASDLVRKFSLLSGGKSVVLNAPLLAPSVAVAKGLKKEKSVAATFDAGANCDAALFTVGAWEQGQSQLWGMLSKQDQQDGKTSGVIADACGVLVDSKGKEVESDLGERIVSLDSAAIRKIPRRVAVVLGDKKVKALHSVLISGLITDLVVDESTAHALLKMQ